MAAVIILQKVKKGQARGKQWGISKLSNLTIAILISKSQWEYLGKNMAVTSKMAEWCESGSLKDRCKSVQT